MAEKKAAMGSGLNKPSGKTATIRCMFIFVKKFIPKWSLRDNPAMKRIYREYSTDIAINVVSSGYELAAHERSRPSYIP